MRTALAAALVMILSTGWAAEPSAPNTKTEVAAKPSPAKRDERVADAATTATVDKRPFKPPYGYRLKRVDGSDVYCAKLSTDGSRFKTEVCKTEAELRDMQRANESMKNELDRRQRSCAGVGCTRR